MAALACGLEIGVIHYYVSKEPHKRQEMLNFQEKNTLLGFPILGAFVVYRVIKGIDVSVMFVVAMFLLGMYIGIILCKRNEWFRS